jgi:hypothetical protein
MNTRFGLICAAVVAILAGAAKAADTEIKLTKTNYTAGNPATVNPEGTWKKPAGVNWKVIWDYGTKVNNTFTLDTASGSPSGGTKNLNDTDTSGTWGPLTAAENLPNPIPANYVVRLRLLKLVDGNYEAQVTDYKTLPPAGGD